jgi:1-acyl-sn-glycerol-3-phosphate acyltransferase
MKIFAKSRFFINAFIIYFIAGTIMVPLMLIYKNRRSDILHKYNALIMKLIGGKIERHGKRDNSADLFVMNHQGVIDIIAMEADENTDIRWIAKKELFELPWLGNLLKLPEMISIDRENKAGLVKLLKDAKRVKESKPHSVMAIFPEGTRNPNQKLRKFKSGTKLLAEKLNLKIQPIIITNSKKLLNEHELTSEPATVHITYLDSFTPDKNDKEWFNRLQEQMQEVIDREESLGRYR